MNYSYLINQEANTACLSALMLNRFSFLNEGINNHDLIVAFYLSNIRVGELN